MADDIRTSEASASTTGEPSLGELFRQLAEDSSTLVKQEIALAKTEMSRNVKSAARDAVMVAVGASMALLGVLVLLAAVVILLGDAIDNYGLAALIVAVIFLGIGGVLAVSNLNKLKHEELAPDRTIKTLQEDKRWIQNEIQQAKTDLRT